MDLSEFLLARIAEDEAVARAVIADLLIDEQDGISGAWFIRYDSMNLWQSDVEHIARHDPARVLGECEAKRRIVEGCADLRRTLDYYGVPTSFDDENILALLALPYADHPDYREEWKP